MRDSWSAPKGREMIWGILSQQKVTQNLMGICLLDFAQRDSVSGWLDLPTQGPWAKQSGCGLSLDLQWLLLVK